MKFILIILALSLQHQQILSIEKDQFENCRFQNCLEEEQNCAIQNLNGQCLFSYLNQENCFNTDQKCLKLNLTDSFQPCWNACKQANTTVQYTQLINCYEGCGANSFQYILKQFCLGTLILITLS